MELIERIVGGLKPATWKYKKEFAATLTHKDGKEEKVMLPLNDRDRERVGIVYDDLPQELVAPGEEKGISAGLLSSFALAALKVLWDKNQQLEQRLAILEAR